MASRRYLPVLSSRDRAQIKRVARELASMGERDPEIVMLSGGYAEVYPASGGYARVLRRGKTTRVRLAASPNRRKNPSKKRPSARACSSRGHRLRVQSTTSAGRGLRACRSNPLSAYVQSGETIQEAAQRAYGRSARAAMSENEYIALRIKGWHPVGTLIKWGAQRSGAGKSYWVFAR